MHKCFTIGIQEIPIMLSQLFNCIWTLQVVVTKPGKRKADHFMTIKSGLYRVPYPGDKTISMNENDGVRRSFHKKSAKNSKIRKANNPAIFRRQRNSENVIDHWCNKRKRG